MSYKIYKRKRTPVLNICLAFITGFSLLCGGMSVPVLADEGPIDQVTEAAAQGEEQPFILSNVVCWGDSLTKGDFGDGVTYPDVLSSFLPEYVNVVNASTTAGGENSITVVCRCGARNFVLDQDFAMPSPGEEAYISFCADTGQWVNPIRRHPDRQWRVAIQDVWGTLRIVQEDPPDLQYTFTPDADQAFEAFTAEAGTPLYLEQYDEYVRYEDYYPIIYIGQNGGWDDTEDLISQQKAILERYGDGKHYLIVGFHYFIPDDRWMLENVYGEDYDNALAVLNEKRDSLDAALQQEFGDRYVNVRQYMIQNGLESEGLTATENDLALMAQGFVPESLRSDNVHFNAYGYEALGRLIYQRMVDLGDVIP